MKRHGLSGPDRNGRRQAAGSAETATGNRDAGDRDGGELAALDSRNSSVDVAPTSGGCKSDDCARRQRSLAAGERDGDRGRRSSLQHNVDAVHGQKRAKGTGDCGAEIDVELSLRSGPNIGSENVRERRCGRDGEPLARESQRSKGCGASADVAHAEACCDGVAGRCRADVDGLAGPTGVSLVPTNLEDLKLRPAPRAAGWRRRGERVGSFGSRYPADSGSW